MTAAAQKRIVVFRIGNIGNTVVALTCFHTVRRAFGIVRRIESLNLRKPGQKAETGLHAELDAELEPQRDKLRALIGRAPGDPR